MSEEETIESLRAQVASLKCDFGIQRECWIECERKLAALRAELAVALQTIEKQGADFGYCYRAKESLRVENERLRQELFESDNWKALASMRGQVCDLTKENERLRQQHLQESASLLVERGNLTAQLAAAEDERDRNYGKLKYLMGAIVDAGGSVSQPHDVVHHANEIRKLGEQLAAVREQLRLCNVDQCNTEAQLATTTNKLEQSQYQTECVENDLVKVQQQLAVVTKERDAAIRSASRCLELSRASDATSVKLTAKLAASESRVTALEKALTYCAAGPGELHPLNQAQYLVARAALSKENL